MTEFPQSGKSRRRRFAPLAVVAGVGATAALALSMTGTLSAFTATITNSQNTVSTGTVVMAETGLNSTGSSVTCTSNDGTTTNGTNTGNNIAANSSQCAVINKYGYNTTLVPGGTSSATVSFKNTGTAAAGTFTLAAQPCVQTGQVTTGTVVSSLDLCSKIGIVITHTVGGTTTTITPVNSTLASINTTPPTQFGTLGSVAANSSQTDSFTFTLTVPSLGNTYQGLTVSQPLVWTYSAGS